MGEKPIVVNINVEAMDGSTVIVAADQIANAVEAAVKKALS